MVLPAVIAALGITEAVWVLAIGAIQFIAFVIGVGWVGSSVRDSITKIEEGNMAASRDEIIEAILARDDIGSGEKLALIQAYLSSLEAKEPIDWGKTIIYAVAILAAAYIATSVIGGKK